MNDQKKLKIVIRNLPCTMTKESFLEKYKNVTTFDYFQFYPNNMLEPKNLPFIIIKFKTSEDMVLFYNFISSDEIKDENGNEHKCIIEFCMNQSIPVNEQYDHLGNTIESDRRFINFLKHIDEPKESISNKFSQDLLLKEIELRKQTFSKSKNTELTEHIIHMLKTKKDNRTMKYSKDRKKKHSRSLRSSQKHG
ncbi:hypothetical protein A3Q56_01643 [Intoshia linei]|uniref:UPF3 domain-containing protein n=1 Tax=Intoshia linei TaxID=1819745 RepID=A0A177B8J0_9BILA|nr:hypothetical protein A3Q56_01643 [Intoshia linei]